MADAKTIGKRLDAMVALATKAIALEIAAELREAPPVGTPIKTAWARSNWITTIGAPHVGTVGTPDNINSTEAAAGDAAIAGYRGKGPIYITNNVPYIRKLNDGHSPQTPKGFVERAVAKGTRVGAAEALKVGG